MSNILCKCGKVGAISCPNDERCGPFPNIQLPAEEVQAIEEQANDYAEETSGRKGRVETYIAGATAYAIKLHQAQQEIENLTNQLKNHSGVSNENMKLLQQENERLQNDFDLYKDETAETRTVNIEAIKLLKKVIYRHEGGLLPDRLLYNEIKTFLDGK